MFYVYFEVQDLMFVSRNSFLQAAKRNWPSINSTRNFYFSRSQQLGEKLREIWTNELNQDSIKYKIQIEKVGTIS